MKNRARDAAIPGRLLHTMLRVSDLERSITFYCKGLGMRELRREEFPEAGFTLSFLGYGNENETAVLELTHNHGAERYELGTAYGHIAVEVADVDLACKRLKSMGVSIVRPPGPMKHASTRGTRDYIAFVQDPDGYRIELLSA